MSARGNPNGFPTRDWSTEDGAHALARMIRKFWQAQGRDVTVTVRREGNPPPPRVVAVAFWSVRSNLVNGLPPVAKLVKGRV